MEKIAITSDCVCDMSESLLEEYGVKVIHFYITTDHGCFRDMDEITSGNVVEYFNNGGQHIHTKAPFPIEYERFFSKVLQDCDEIIHMTVTSTLSLSYEYAKEASKKFDGRVSVIDTGHLSTGIAHLVIRGAELVKEGKSSGEIVTELMRVRALVSTSFIAENADYLWRAGRISKFVKDACSLLKIHPVLRMKNGYMQLRAVKIGNYEKAVLRYVRGELRRTSRIDKKRVFITYAACPLRVISKAKKEVESRCRFEKILVGKASATISSNCGANTLGVLFVRTKE